MGELRERKKRKCAGERVFKGERGKLREKGEGGIGAGNCSPGHWRSLDREKEIERETERGDIERSREGRERGLAGKAGQWVPAVALAADAHDQRREGEGENLKERGEREE